MGGLRRETCALMEYLTYIFFCEFFRDGNSTNQSARADVLARLLMNFLLCLQITHFVNQLGFSSLDASTVLPSKKANSNILALPDTRN